MANVGGPRTGAQKAPVMDIHPTPKVQTHKTLAAPVENPDVAPDTDSTPKLVLSPSKKVVIKPLHDNIVPDTKPEPTPAPKAVAPEPAAEAPTTSASDIEAISVSVATKTPEAAQATEAVAPSVVEATPATESATLTPASPDPTPEAAPAPEVEKPAPIIPQTVDDIADEDESSAEAAAKKAQKEHDAAIVKLVQSQKYFVPIKTVRQRRARRALWLVPLVLVVLVVTGDAALDAGLVANSYDLPHTTFIKK